MKLNKLARLATVSAVALTVTMSAGQVWAAAYDLDSGTALPITVNAGVDNTVDVVTTAADFQNVGVTSDTVDLATLVLNPDDTIVEDVVGPARIISDDGAGAAANVAITNAFPNSDIYVTFQNPTNLTCGACAGPNPVLTLSNVTTNLTTPGTLSPAVQGRGTTTALGALNYDIGVTIVTVATADNYLTGTYTGSFDITMQY